MVNGSDDLWYYQHFISRTTITNVPHSHSHILLAATIVIVLLAYDILTLAANDQPILYCIVYMRQHLAKIFETHIQNSFSSFRNQKKYAIKMKLPSNLEMSEYVEYNQNKLSRMTVHVVKLDQVQTVCSSIVSIHIIQC